MHKLCLQVALLVNGTVEESLEAQIPEKARRKVFAEKVLDKVASKICQLILPQVHRLTSLMTLVRLSDTSMEKLEIPKVDLDYLVEYFAVFFTECARLKFTVCYCFSVCQSFVLQVDPIQTFRVCDYNVQPNIGFHL